MKFLSLQPFIPSGKDMNIAKSFFQELGFAITWDSGDLAGFEKDGCSFILQHYDHKLFAENLMISVHITDANSFHKELIDKKLNQKFGIRFTAPIRQPYGLEVNIIDPAGVCWHFVQEEN